MVIVQSIRRSFVWNEAEDPVHGRARSCSLGTSFRNMALYPESVG